MAKQRELDIQMAELKTDIKYIKKSMDENTEQHGELKEMIEKYINSIDNKFDGLDNKYASKNVERLLENILKFFGITIGTFLLSGVLYLIVIHGFVGI